MATTISGGEMTSDLTPAWARGRLRDVHRELLVTSRIRPSRIAVQLSVRGKRGNSRRPAA